MIKYTKDKYDKLKSQFPKSDEIISNESQAYQDMFVLSMLNGKENGTFLEIGAFNPRFISNTYLLETNYNWNGISIDIAANTKNQFKSRKSKFVLGNALTLDYKQMLSEHNMPKQIDYLQIDIEPLTQTFECLKKLPLDDYRFSVITYETDFYDPATPLDVRERVRKESREYFKSYGYELIVGNLCNTSTTDPFEDWYVDPTVVSPELIQLYKTEGEFNNTSEQFMLK